MAEAAGGSMRIFSAQLATETNTFTPIPTGLRSYQQMGIHHGDASLVAPEGAFSVLLEWRRLSRLDGHQYIEGLAAQAQPGGRTVRGVYEDFRDEILRDIEAALPLDAILLSLHGAMAAEGYDDCEGDLLERIRAMVGPQLPIGVELDLHCHLTWAMTRATDIIIAYKEYPHTDLLERAGEVYRLTLAAARREVKPVISVSDCRMVGLWRTTTPQMRSFIDQMTALEQQPRVLSASFGHGFPWGDVAEGGAKTWVVTDDRADLGERCARGLTDWLWDNREIARASTVDIEEALDIVAAAASTPLVLADGADNPGGGAPSDSTFILRKMLQRRIGNSAIGFMFDPAAVATCCEAGVGATLALRIGGKLGPTSGQPLDLSVTVRAIREHHSQKGLSLTWPMGTAVWVETAHQIDILLTSVRSQPFDPEAFTQLGISLSSKRAIVLKSTQHFHEKFAPLAQRVIYVDAPGALSHDFATLPYTMRSSNYWPRVADPWRARD